MAEQLLIAQSDLAQIFDLSPNVSYSGRVEPIVWRVQRTDIRNFLGDALYADVNENSATPENTLLLNGGTYTNSAGDTVYLYGLKLLISTLTAADFMRNAHTFATRTGARNMTFPQSEIADSEERALLANEYKNTSVSYMNSIRDFLNDNQTNYPLWGKSCKFGGDMRIATSTRTGYNIF